jgi:hypothetical protein
VNKTGNLVSRSERGTITDVYDDKRLKGRKNRRRELLNDQFQNLHSSCNIAKEIKLKKRYGRRM